jgi:hypothetical protein
MGNLVHLEYFPSFVDRVQLVLNEIPNLFSARLKFPFNKNFFTDKHLSIRMGKKFILVFEIEEKMIEVHFFH